MNKLFLIGNGFDLAHGLKTRYSDFLLWYLNKIVKNLKELGNIKYSDDLVFLKLKNFPPEEFDSLKSFKEFVKLHGEFKCKHDFFDRLINISTDFNWVDIEYEYYDELLKAYNNVISADLVKSKLAGQYVNGINNCLDLIKEQLVEYLRTVKLEQPNISIESRFSNDLIEKDIRYNKVLFLVFNYTHTIELYVYQLKRESQSQEIIYIHGQLRNPNNPIIFGYGDEMNEYYSKIENLNLNEFLKNMKSFSYLKTNNYQKLNRFINDGQYKVSIMGHSCGLSDRVLLNSIFCHPNCYRIRIYYYLKPNDQNDYGEKTMEISRHFPLSQKDRMRNIIQPLSESTPLAE
jgi:hypothetical protein